MVKDSANLDMLRSFAVLIVLTVHILICGLRIEQVGPVSLRAFGRWGVLIFFVHTCLVLSYSLERNSAFWPFLARRVFRIYPLSVVVVLCVVALAIPVGFPGDHFSLPNREPSNVLLNLLLLQNISGGISVLAPLWSLPYEMQMYLLLPALFYLISRRIRFLEYLLWTLGVLLAANSWRAEIRGFPSLIFLPSFLSGFVAYRSPAKPTYPSWLWAPTLMAITLVFAFYPVSETGWVCCLLVGLAIPRFKELSNGAARKAFAVIARYSYGIYLLHFICIWFAFDRLKNFSAWTQWIAFVITAVCSVYFAYNAIEAPMIRLGSKVASSLVKRNSRQIYGPQRGSSTQSATT